MTSSLVTNASGTSQEPFDWSSPYPLPVIIVAGAICAALSIITVVGNLMVMLSFYIDKNIRQASNYFIFSLAVSDFIIGLEGFPLYSIYALHGEKWTMGWFLCDLWLSVDYTVCLASTYTVLFITIDRYCSVKIPTTYRNWRTHRKVLAIIAITWILPALLFFISVFGWSYFSGQGRILQEHECMVQFMVDPYFNMSMYISYYWSTLVVMFVLYAGIYRAARELHLKSKQKRQQFQAICALRATTTPITLKTSSVKGDEEDYSQATPEPSNESSEDNNNKAKEKPARQFRLSLCQKSPFNAFRSYSWQKSSCFQQPISEEVTSCKIAAADEPSKDVVQEPEQRRCAEIESENKEDGSSRPSSDKNESTTTESSENGDRFSSTNEDESPKRLELIRRRTLPAYANDSLRSTALAKSPRSSRIKSLNLSNLTYIDVDYPSLRSPEEFFILDIGMKEDMSPTSTSSSAASSPEETDKKVNNQAEHATTGNGRKRSREIVEETEPAPGLPVSMPNLKPCQWEAALQITPEKMSRSVGGRVKESPKSTTTAVANASTSDVESTLNSHKEMVQNAGLLRNNDDDATKKCWTVGKFQLRWEYHSSFFKSSKGERPKTNHSEITVDDVKKSNNSNDTARLLPCSGLVNTTKTKMSKMCWSRAKSKKQKKKKRKEEDEENEGPKISMYKKSKSENRARKALRTITVILGAFVLFWTPFYVLATLYGFCENCVPKTVYVISYYMCYMNSPINPFCYALANAQFKKTLTRMLRGDFHRI